MYNILLYIYYYVIVTFVFVNVINKEIRLC